MEAHKEFVEEAEKNIKEKNQTKEDLENIHGCFYFARAP